MLTNPADVSKKEGVTVCTIRKGSPVRYWLMHCLTRVRLDSEDMMIIFLFQNITIKENSEL